MLLSRYKDDQEEKLNLGFFCLRLLKKGTETNMRIRFFKKLYTGKFSLHD